MHKGIKPLVRKGGGFKGSPLFLNVGSSCFLVPVSVRLSFLLSFVFLFRLGARPEKDKKQRSHSVIVAHRCSNYFVE